MTGAAVVKWTLVINLMWAFLVGTASAQSDLRDEPVIENGLFSISVADKIRRECGSISGRLLKAQREMRALVDRAIALGYSEDQIRAYVNDTVEKTRMRARRNGYLSDKGVVETRPETYCIVGRAEIEKSSKIGALLRAR